MASGLSVINFRSKIILKGPFGSERSSVRVRMIVRYRELGGLGCPLLGGSRCIKAMLNSIRATGFVRYIETVPAPGRVRYGELGGLGCPLLGGSRCIKAMLNSIRATGFVRYMETVRSSEGPLWEVPL